jgi:hypothetical protein
MEPRFEVRYFTTRKMITEFARKHSVGPRWPLMIAFWSIYILFLLIPLLVGALGKMQEIMIIALGIIMLYLGFMPHIYAGSTLRAVKKQNDGIMPETVITIGDTIELREGMIHITVEYRKLVKVFRLKHSYVLMMGKRNGVMLDPNGFTKGTFEEFKQFLREVRPDLAIPE